MFFNFFAFWRNLCLSLERKNLQTSACGFDLFLWNLPMWWQWSNSISSVISNLFLIIFLTSSCNFPRFRLLFLGCHQSEHCSAKICLLVLLSSPWQEWDLKAHFRRSVWTFLILLFTFAKPSWRFSWVNLRLLVKSATSCEILSRRSLVFVSWDLIILLIFSWWSCNSSLTIFLIVSIKSSLFSSVAGVVGVAAAVCWVLNEIFGVVFDLLFN